MTTLEIETPRVFKPLLAPARYKGAEGGRGSAKSHFFASLMIEEHIAFPHDSVCIREVQKSLDQSVKKLLEEKIESMGVGYMFTVQDKRIICPGDKVIIFQGMQNHTAESIKSLEGYMRAWVEEAQTLSQNSLDLLRPTIRMPDSEIWFSWNGKHPDDPVELLLKGDDPHPNSIVVKANYEDNPWFPDVLREEMEYDKKRDYDKYLHVWMGGYEKSSETRVFKNWTIEEFEAPDDAIFRLGADWGYAVDPTVLVRSHISGKKLYIDYEAYEIGCDIDFTPDLFDQVPEARKWPITADSSRPEVISYMNKNGFPRITRAIKGAGSIKDGIEFLKSYDIVVHPRCTHTIDELTNYSWKTDPQTNKVLPLLEDKHNHVIDALRYACEGARKATKPAKKAKKQPVQSANSWMG